MPQWVKKNKSKTLLSGLGKEEVFAKKKQKNKLADESIQMLTKEEEAERIDVDVDVGVDVEVDVDWPLARSYLCVILCAKSLKHMQTTGVKCGKI